MPREVLPPLIHIRIVVIFFVSVRLNLGRLEVGFLEELYREFDFLVRRLHAERHVAGLDGHTTHLAVTRHVLTENLAERPRLVFRGTSNALLTKERYSVHQQAGLFLVGNAVDADLTRAARATLAILRVPDGTAIAAGNEWDVDRRDGNAVLDGLDGLHSWCYYVSNSLASLYAVFNFNFLFQFGQ